MKNRIYISLALIASAIAILSFESEKKLEDRQVMDLLSVDNIIPFDSSSRLHEGRPKIEWICYGQSFEHECEETSTLHSAQSFLKLQHAGGIDSIDVRLGKGSKVRYFRSASSNYPGDRIDSSGTVLSGFTLGNIIAASEGNEIENYLQEAERVFKIKPRIRIDSAFAVNNPSARVCEVIVCDSRGRIVKKSVIKAANFFEDFNSGYDGNYKDNFNFLGMGDTSMLSILGKALETGTHNKQRANYTDTGLQEIQQYAAIKNLLAQTDDDAGQGENDGRTQATPGRPTTKEEGDCQRSGNAYDQERMPKRV